MFDVVYDATRDYWSNPTYIAVIALLLLWNATAFAMLFWSGDANPLSHLRPHRSSELSGKIAAERVIPCVFLLIGVSTMAGLLMIYWTGFSELKSALETGNCRQVNGTIGMSPGETARSQIPQTFEISGGDFSFEHGLTRNGSFRLHTRSSLARPGTRVRLCYFERHTSNVIVRLEVARNN